MNTWRANNPSKVASYKLTERYNITVEIYTSMWKSQDGKCAICNNVETAINPASNKLQKLAVYHCHKTGKVRELLCQDCNRGIAKFQEDPVRLHNAIQYLFKHLAK